MAVAPALALARVVGLGPGEVDASAQISWEAPLECPSARSLEQRVDAYLGRAFAGEASVVVAGRVRATAGGFVLELTTEVDGMRDRQRLTHHDCAALLELAASLAAIAIDPLALANPGGPPGRDPHQRQPPLQRPRTHEPIRATTTEVAELAELAELATLAELAKPSSPEPETGPTPSAELPNQLEAPAAPPVSPDEFGPLYDLYASPSAGGQADDPTTDARRTRALVLATGGLALNLFPNPAPQVRGGVGVQHDMSRLALRAQVDAGATLAGRFRSVDRSAGGDLLAWDVAIHPCAVPRWGIVELRVCAAFGGGQIRARAVGVGNAIRRVHPWLWLASEAGLAVTLGRNVALVLDLGLDFNLLRPNFSVAGPDAAYLTPIVSGHGRLGVELRFL
jgi:hypothetical protein